MELPPVFVVASLLDRRRATKPLPLLPPPVPQNPDILSFIDQREASSYASLKRDESRLNASSKSGWWEQDGKEEAEEEAEVDPSNE